jgi:short-subunit dehydrogenase
VADPAQVEAAAQRAEDELGPIDVWVNDAIAVIFSPFKDIEPEDFKRSTEVCYLGAVYGTKAALKRMLPRDRGTIVQVGSALSYRAIPLQSAYCGAKHAMRGFTDSVRTELLHDGSNVHITMVQLPAVNTPQFNVSKTTLPKHPQPVPPIYQPEVPARAIYWAAHQRRREVRVGLSSTIVIAGNKLLPGLGDRYLARTGYDSQQTNQPVDENRPDNLYKPVAGDHGAHGDFDEESHEESPQLWATEHLGLLALAGGAGLLAAAVLFGRR